ncbi:DNA polymerase, partial [Staphylococcus haemolyticus]|uniref:DNA polymerase n=1 Tax=Staphylococcus haemolyticus TaxID=1283 RepID=UPI00374E9DE9
PNLQNIPLPLEQPPNITKPFNPTSNHTLILSPHYSQIQLPLLPHITQHQTMKQPFINQKHLHTPTPIKLFHLQPNQLNPLIPTHPKALNFPILYP